VLPFSGSFLGHDVCAVTFSSPPASSSTAGVSFDVVHAEITAAAHDAARSATVIETNTPRRGIGGRIEL
jgi:hypothetical protein